MTEDIATAPRRGRPPRGRDETLSEGLGGMRTAAEAEIVRPAVRDNPYGLDSTRARQRAAELRDNGALLDGEASEFHIPAHIVQAYENAGWSIEWKRYETFGKEDRSHQVEAQRRGWEPVPQERHKDIVVRQHGMVLMERPLEITRQAYNQNQIRASVQVENKELQLTSGEKLDQDTVDRTGRNRGTFVKRSMEASPIPD